jgi:hypothetical protein
MRIATENKILDLRAMLKNNFIVVPYGTQRKQNPALFIPSGGNS